MLQGLGTNFLIEELIFLPMGESMPIYNRPYVVNATADAVKAISTNMVEAGSTKVTPHIVGQYTDQLIQPNATALPTQINSNWCSDRRYIFVLRVLDQSIPVQGVESILYIQGYTDRQGISLTGAVDDTMLMYINTVIETSRTTIHSPTGVQRLEKLNKIYTVLSSGNDLQFTQRPMDIVKGMELHNYAIHMNDSGFETQGMNAGSMLDPYNNRVLGSVVSNNIKSNYLSRVINAGVTDSYRNQAFIDSAEHSMFMDSTSDTMEPAIRDNSFLKYMFKLSGYQDPLSYFSFSMLGLCDNTIYDRFVLYNITKNLINPNLLNTPTLGEYWHGQDPVTLKAYSLIESSVAMATKYGFNKLFFTVTNMEVNSLGPKVYITDFKSFLGLGERDFRILLDSFCNDIIVEVINGETMGGRIPIYAEVYVDLLGTTKINLSYSGYPATWYTIPTTANSLYSPVTTIDKASLDKTIEHFTSLVQYVAHPEYNVNY